MDALGEFELDVEATLDPDSNHVEINVEFVNVSAQDEFEWDLVHQSGPQLQTPQLYGRNRTRRCETTFTVQEEWTPMQDGPIPSIVPFGSLQNEIDWFVGTTDTFAWGDVVNNNHPPIANIRFSYPGEAEEYVHHETDVLYLDIANNETRQENIEVEFDVFDTERMGDYRLDFRIAEYQDTGIVRPWDWA